MHELVGCIHVHSKFSDGSGDVQEIMSYADEVNLDYVALTDHNTLRALDEGLEKWYNNTLLLVGCEINDKQNKNHYLALGIDQTIPTRLKPQDYINKVNNSGGIGFIAHPHEKRNSMDEHPPYPWTAWDAEGFTGIEIWNHMSEWMEGLTEQNKYNHFVHPLRSVQRPCEETVSAWDKLNKEKLVVGIGGIDAHAHKVNLLGFFEVEVFPYKVLFKSIRTHVLTSKKIIPGKEEYDLMNAKSEIYDSLRKGRCFISNYYQGDARGFRFFGETGSKIYQMGDAVPNGKKVKLRVLIPDETGAISLIKDGQKIHSTSNFDMEYVANEPGVYRVEVYQNNNAWIFSNPIRIGI